MIIQLILQIIISTVNILFSWVPEATTLPLGIDGVFVSMVGYYESAIVTVPYLGIVFECFKYVIYFEILLSILKLFLGSRTPTHSTN